MMWLGVLKSGSPISRWTIERPVASSARARTSTSKAVSWPIWFIRSAGAIAIAPILSSQFQGTVEPAPGVLPGEGRVRLVFGSGWASDGG